MLGVLLEVVGFVEVRLGFVGVLREVLGLGLVEIVGVRLEEILMVGV